jgi:guanylate kinase
MTFMQEPSSHCLRKGLLIILSAPAGTGKTTLVQRLTENNPRVVASVSFTTRDKREGERDGIHYNFVTKEAFEKKITDGDFLEYVDFVGQYYGTSQAWVEQQRLQGKHVILTIDTQGGLLLKNKVDAVYIFVLPPSLEEQRQRLENRRTESQENVEKRLQRTPLELQAAGQYDYAVVNDDLDKAVETLECIITAEEHRIRHLLNDEACPQLLKELKKEVNNGKKT